MTLNTATAFISYGGLTCGNEAPPKEAVAGLRGLTRSFGAHPSASVAVAGLIVTATAITRPVCPSRVARSRPVATFQIPRPVTVAGGQPAAIRRHRSRLRLAGVAPEGARSRPVATSKIRTAPSQLPEVGQLPSAT